jgi:putative transposase
MGLRCKGTRKFVVTTDSKHKHPVATNPLNGKLSVAAPNAAWMSGITYIKAGAKYHYLTVFINLFPLTLVGWDLSESLESKSAIYALKKVIMRRRPAPGLMIHSDRGIQYPSSSFRPY